jgi:hypothetical protein
LLSCQKLPEYGTNLSSVLKDITNNRMWIVTTMISSWLVKENWWYDMWEIITVGLKVHSWIFSMNMWGIIAVGLKVHSWILNNPANTHSSWGSENVCWHGIHYLSLWKRSLLVIDWLFLWNSNKM